MGAPPAQPGWRREGPYPQRDSPHSEEPRAIRPMPYLRVLGLVLTIQLLQVGLLVYYLVNHTSALGSKGQCGEGECTKWCSAAALANMSCDGQVAAKPKGYVPPEFLTCDLQIMGGRAKDNYGSWPLCLNQVPKNAIIYSFGIGGDVSFDITMIKRGCRVFAFDPTVKPLSVQSLFKPHNEKLLSSFTFMQVGLGPHNGVVSFSRPLDKRLGSMTSLATGTIPAKMFKKSKLQAAVLTLPTLMAVLRHDRIDLLKVDVEGVEFDVCESKEFQRALDKVGQIIFEFHERHLKDPRGRKDRCIELLSGYGFKEVNRTITEEYVFARMRPAEQIAPVPQIAPAPLIVMDSYT